MIAVMLIMGVIGVSIISLTRSSEQSYLSANSNARAYYLAESGLRYAQTIYCEDGWRHGRERTLRLDGGEKVEVVRLVNTFWATSIVDEDTPKEARARVPMPLSLCGVDPEVEAQNMDQFAIFGEVGISLGNNTIIRGDVAISGADVDIKGDVEGNVLARNIEFTGQGTVTGDIFGSGFVDIKTGHVTGDIHANGTITLGSAQSTVFGGWLFSQSSIFLQGKSQVAGHVHACNGNVSLSGSASIGTAAEPVEVRATGDIYLSGSTKIYGNVYAGGSIVMGSGTIYGNAYAGGTISNGSITGAVVPNSPTYVKAPVCPDLTNLENLDLPAATEFTAGGSSVNVKKNQSVALAPGGHGHLSTVNNASNSQLTLNAGSTGHGNYYFDSFSLGGNMTLRLDLSGTHDIRIFVEGDIDIGRDLNVLVSTNGTNYVSMTDASVDPFLAARVYWESTSDFSLGSSCNWFGAVFTPEGNLSVSNGGYLIGSFFSGGGHNIQATTVVHVPPNYFTGN
ncbi:MAG: DUF7305 domain-containing protein [Verrucomicrobiaceae bacterium]